MDLCPDCNMPDPSHASDCPVRLARKSDVTGNPLVDQLTAWAKGDADVNLMVNGVMRNRKVTKLAELPAEVVEELHGVVKDFLDESPTENRPAWAR